MTNITKIRGQVVGDLLVELVELGREAWRLDQRQKAVRAQLDELYLVEEGEWV